MCVCVCVRVSWQVADAQDKAAVGNVLKQTEVRVARANTHTTHIEHPRTDLHRVTLESAGAIRAPSQLKAMRPLLCCVCRPCWHWWVPSLSTVQPFCQRRLNRAPTTATSQVCVCVCMCVCVCVLSMQMCVWACARFCVIIHALARCPDFILATCVRRAPTYCHSGQAVPRCLMHSMMGWTRVLCHAGEVPWVKRSIEANDAKAKAKGEVFGLPRRMRTYVHVCE